MPAMLEDPSAPPKYRVSGAEPYHTPSSPLPPDVAPRLVTLRDRTTAATLVPFTSPDQVPPGLLQYLSDQFAREVEKGDTYPMLEPMPLEDFGPYWFGLFAAVMIIGDIQRVVTLLTSESDHGDWPKDCLGSFYIKPNYPGRSSHICNAGFLTTDASRGRGVGRLMGEGYLEWAPKLGYTYSVFNLVYENNIASCRIWDALGFKRIGRVPGAGNLKSHPDQLIDAIIYGRELGTDIEEVASEERFEKIRYYLRTGQYPNTADRAQKSRLRSAAMHYRLAPAAEGGDEERLMLKDKEVVADVARQTAIARDVHVQQHHAGINKTTATIAETYHWTRIKETASLTIRNCPKCKEMSKAPVIRPDQALFGNGNTPQGYTSVSAVGRDVDASGANESAASSQSQTRSRTRNSQQQRGSSPYQQAAQDDGSAQRQQSVPLDPQLVQRLQSANEEALTEEPSSSSYQPASSGTPNAAATASSQDHTKRHQARESSDAPEEQAEYQMSAAQDEWISYISSRRQKHQLNEEEALEEAHLRRQLTDRYGPPPEEGHGDRMDES